MAGNEVLDYARLIQKGHIHCIDEPEPSGAYELSRKFDGLPAVYFTRTRPQEIRERYGTNGSDVFWLTTNQLEKENCIGPNNISQVFNAMRPYIARGGLIVIDCMEYLASQNSFDQVLRFTQFLYDHVAGSGARVLISMDKLAFGTKESRLLVKNMNDLTGLRNELLGLESKVESLEART